MSPPSPQQLLMFFIAFKVSSPFPCTFIDFCTFFCRLEKSLCVKGFYLSQANRQNYHIKKTFRVTVNLVQITFLTFSESMNHFSMNEVSHPFVVIQPYARASFKLTLKIFRWQAYERHANGSLDKNCFKKTHFLAAINFKIDFPPSRQTLLFINLIIF